MTDGMNKAVVTVEYRLPVQNEYFVPEGHEDDEMSKSQEKQRAKILLVPMTQGKAFFRGWRQAQSPVRKPVNQWPALLHC
jgi:hypothetical protein